MRVRITLREFQNILEIGPAPRIDRLGVIADDHHVLVLGRERVNEVRLDFVRVLIFVHQNELKLPPVKPNDVLVFDQHPQCFFEQIIEIERVRRLFLSFIAGMHILDLLEQRQEIRELFGEQFLHRPLRVDRKAEEIGKHVTLGKTNLLWIDSSVGNNGRDQVSLVLPVHNGETRGIAEGATVTSQHSVSDRVKGAAPDPGGIDR